MLKAKNNLKGLCFRNLRESKMTSTSRNLHSNFAGYFSKSNSATGTVIIMNRIQAIKKKTNKAPKLTMKKAVTVIALTLGLFRDIFLKPKTLQKSKHTF